jgi:hypothetical protein
MQTVAPTKMKLNVMTAIVHLELVVTMTVRIF